ncbi:unnamed protein product, partial [Musa hybrid cultivar]
MNATMSMLSMVEAKLPPGFRFHPGDDELICDYLAAKAAGGSTESSSMMMVDVDLNKCEPWDLPEFRGLYSCCPWSRSSPTTFAASSLALAPSSGSGPSSSTPPPLRAPPRT